jgi:hypothetical protein
MHRRGSSRLKEAARAVLPIYPLRRVRGKDDRFLGPRSREAKRLRRPHPLLKVGHLFPDDVAVAFGRVAFVRS